MQNPHEVPTIAELADALMLFNEPILNSRYHGMLERYPEQPMREELVALPGLVLRAERAGRAAAVEWTALGPTPATDRFMELGQLALLDSFVDLAESELALIALMAREAPTRAIRARFDDMADTQRRVASQLRVAASKMSGTRASRPHGTLRSVQEENSLGNLRHRIETAIHDAQLAGKRLRNVRLSSTAVRHLRDQGCFRGGERTVAGIPIVVDLSWEASAFAIEGQDVVSLDEIMAPT